MGMGMHRYHGAERMHGDGCMGMGAWGWEHGSHRHGAWHMHRHGNRIRMGMAEKRQKIRNAPSREHPPPSSKVGFASGRGAKNFLRTLSPCVSEPFCIFAKTLTMKKPIIMKSISNGLDIRGGRLINNRPCSINGIQRAAQLKSDMKREKKVSMIAEGIRRAEMESELGYQMLTTMPIKRR